MAIACLRHDSTPARAPARIPSLTLLTIVLFSVLMSGQEAELRIRDIQPLPYDVVSIRRNVSGAPMARAGDYHGRLARSNTTLRALIETVFGVRSFLVVGGPEWIDRDRFDVIVSAPDVPVQNMRRATLTALQDRFSLRLRREMREIAAYELVKARADGELGERLRAVTGTCRFSYNMKPDAAVWGKCLPWGRIAQLITSSLDRPFVDRTGLSGNFDVNLEWTSSVDVGLQPSDNRVSLFTALEEQLGLKLRPAKSLAEVLIVDAAEPPTEN